MAGRKTKRKIRKTFKEAVEATPEVHECFRYGKQAIIGSEQDKCELTDTRRCGGSLFIDKCLFDQGLYLNNNRWDYAIDYKGEVYFFEVHTPSSGEVRTVINKLQWLKDWLVNKAPEINELRTSLPYFWIQSNGNHILKNSRHERLAIQNGIKPISKLVLI